MRERLKHFDPRVRIAIIAAGAATMFALAALPSLPEVLARTTSQPPLASLLLALALVALTAIDVETFLLPDAITLPLIAAGVVIAWGSGGNPVALAHALAAGAAFALLWGIGASYERWRGQAGLGMGDAKLFAVAGAWLGGPALASVLAYAALAALLSVGVAAVRGRGVGPTSRIPFGPYLAFAIWLVWLYGPIGYSPE